MPDSFRHITIIFLLLLIISLSTPISLAGEDGLVAYWDFNEGTGNVLQDKVGDNNGVLKSGLPGDENLPQWVQGIEGHGLDFLAGKQAYVEIRHSDAIKPTDAITIMAWVKFSGNLSSRREIVGNKTDTGRYGYRLFQRYSNIYFHISDGATDYTYYTSADLKEDTWHHIAATFDGITIKLYVDGEEIGSNELSAPVKINYSNHAIILGNYLGRKDAYPFLGTMDEVRIFNRALSLDQIAEYIRWWENIDRSFEGVLVFPNPSNSEEVRLAYYLNESYPVTIEIYDEKGNLIWNAEKELTEAGYNEVIWEGLDKVGQMVPAGIYTCLIFQRQGALQLLSKGSIVRTFN